MRLGLVDAIGDDTAAIEKAASLAGISHYDLVDVNVEVFRILNQKVMRILEPFLAIAETQTGIVALRPFTGLSGETADAADPLGGAPSLQTLRRLSLVSGVGETQKEALPDFPLEIGRPNLYYLYVGPSE